MMGAFLSRAFVMVFGYAFPAYKCFKTVETNKPDRDHLLFWCHYWILVALITVLERIGDAFISWLPMYSEAKVALYIYLWYPKTYGTIYVYNSFLRPYVSKHEKSIDDNLEELKNRVATIAIVVWQKAAHYGQARFFKILEYVSSQSAPSPRPQSAQAFVNKEM